MKFGDSGKKYKYSKGWPLGQISIYEQLARDPNLQIVEAKLGKFLQTFCPLLGHKTSVKLIDGVCFVGELDSINRSNFTIVLKNAVKQRDPTLKNIPLMNIKQEVINLIGYQRCSSI